MTYYVYMDSKNSSGNPDHLLWCNNIPSSSGQLIIDPTLTMEINRAGSFEFKILPTNDAYNDFVNLRTMIFICDDDSEIWRGRVLDQTDDIYKIRTVTCEGELAFLNDLQATEHDAKDETIDAFLNEVFSAYSGSCASYRMIKKGSLHGFNGSAKFHIDKQDDYHNLSDSILSEMVGKLGGYVKIRRGTTNSNIPTIDNVGYLDYYADGNVISNQTIVFGQNLIDYANKIDGSDVFTAITPIGNTVKNLFPINDRKGGRWNQDGTIHGLNNWTSSGSSIDVSGITRITIYQPKINVSGNLLVINFWKTDRPEKGQLLSELIQDDPPMGRSVTYGSIPSGAKSMTISFHNGLVGKLCVSEGNGVGTWDGTKRLKLTDAEGVDIPYIANDSAVAKRGLIVKVVSYDIDDVHELRKAGENTLNQSVSDVQSLDISSIDARALGLNVNRIDIGDMVRVISDPHGLDAYFQCTKIELRLNSPEENTYSFGYTNKTLSNVSYSNSKSILEYGRTTGVQIQSSSASVINQIYTILASYGLDKDLDNSLGRYVTKEYADSTYATKNELVTLNTNFANNIDTLTKAHNDLVNRVAALENR